MIKWKAKVRYSSGQRGQTVNLLVFTFEGSNPSLTTTITNAGIAQLARASAFQAEGRRFESGFPLHFKLGAVFLLSAFTCLIIDTAYRLKSHNINVVKFNMGKLFAHMAQG